MEKQIIITIGREYGSGGREIAQKLSEKLEISLYDKNILETIFMDNPEEAEKTCKYDEKLPILGTTRHVRGMSNSPEESTAKKQFAFIYDKAVCGESFVVVGRCGSAVLAGREGLIRIFICGDIEERVHRIMERNSLNEKQALSLIKKTDKEREQYHNQYAPLDWGKAASYDLCINSSILGIEGTVKFITQYVEDYEQAKKI